MINLLYHIMSHSNEFTTQRSFPLLRSRQSEQPAQVSSGSRCRTAVDELLGKRSVAHRGFPQQQLCQRPPRWWSDEMTGHILIPFPWAATETERLLGEAGCRWHVSLYFGVCCVCLCEGVLRNLHVPWHLHSIRPLYWNESKRAWRRTAKYSIKTYLLSST